MADQDLQTTNTNKNGTGYSMGVPKEPVFSILVHDILGVNALSSCHSFRSGLTDIFNTTAS